jgi:hypothetical protein
MILISFRAYEMLTNCYLFLWRFLFYVVWFVFSSVFILRIVIVMLHCSYVLQFVVLIGVCDRVCVHAVYEVMDCGILTFLWATRIVAYDQICRYVFSEYV